MNIPTPHSGPGLVVFSHGHESGPSGGKIKALRPVAEALGWATQAIDYRDLRDDPAGRSERLLNRIRKLSAPVVLVGSSMGGWVSMDAAEKHPCVGLFLMAPALFLEHRVPGAPEREAYTPRADRTAVVHGWSDEIIPWENSLRFARHHGATLHLLDSGHRLEGVVSELKALLALFLEGLSSTEKESI